MILKIIIIIYYYIRLYNYCKYHITMLTFPVGHRSTPCELVQSLAGLLRPAFVAANGGCGFENDMVKKWLVNAGETWDYREMVS